MASTANFESRMVAQMDVSDQTRLILRRVILRHKIAEQII